MNEDTLRYNFVAFVELIWEYLHLPEPTPLQRDMAEFLQYGPAKVCIEAFRGCGKSWITAAYVLWLLYCNPQLKIMVVSASKNRSDNFTTFTLSLIRNIPELQHLEPTAEQRCSRVEYDVGPAHPDQAPSVFSRGINSQLTGGRADIIISDDVEVKNNSATADLRDTLIDRTKEYSAILKPLPTSKVVYLGTPQTEDSIYTKLPSTFIKRIWPARVPTTDQVVHYGNDLSPMVREMFDEHMFGEPSDPVRFDENELLEREAEYGKADFQLQFMLNTQLSDQEKFPLKIKDLIVAPVPTDRAPMVVNWLPHRERQDRDLPNLAMSGDYFYHSAGESREFREFESTVMTIDPSGRGADETGYSVVSMLNGYLWIPAAGGKPGGYDDETLKSLAVIAKTHKVNKVVIESNFGDGMFTKLFQPVLKKYHPDCGIEEVRHSVQKERRIIDTLEPVMARHKLIVDPEVIKEDHSTALKYEGERKLSKTLIHQMTRICYDKGALRHDDRLDALAIGVAWFTERMARDEQEGLKAERDELMQKEIDKYLENALGGSPGGPPRWA